MKALTVAQLQRFEPFSRLQESRAAELAGHCQVEEVAKGADPSAGDAGKSVYLIAGEVDIIGPDGSAKVLAAGTPEAAQPLPGISILGPVRGLRARTPLQVTRIDNNLLDIMLTWDQMTTDEASQEGEDGGGAVARTYEDEGWNLLTGVFSVQNLTTGTFAAMPPAHISRMLHCFETINVTRGQVVIREGDPGDYYYVINTGRAQVTRMIGGVSMPLADLKSGAAFGEEALISDTRRNATVTMVTNGTLLRLAKSDFIEMLKKPLLAEVELEEAERRVAAGAAWLDVRFPSEFQHDKMPGAINIPLNELRHAFSVLDQTVEYIVYCQSGRRSSAAAFLLAQRGFRAAVLAGGLWKARGSQ